MFRIISTRAACSLTVLAALVVAAGGCGGQNPSTEPGPIAKPEDLTAVLPTGVKLETPVVADSRYGESSKTVADALASLHAQVKDGVLVAGYIGPEIRFDSEPAAKSKPSATSKKAKKPPVIIRLAH